MSPKSGCGNTQCQSSLTKCEKRSNEKAPDGKSRIFFSITPRTVPVAIPEDTRVESSTCEACSVACEFELSSSPDTSTTSVRVVSLENGPRFESARSTPHYRTKHPAIILPSGPLSHDHIPGAARCSRRKAACKRHTEPLPETSHLSESAYHNNTIIGSTALAPVPSMTCMNATRSCCAAVVQPPTRAAQAAA